MSSDGEPSMIPLDNNAMIAGVIVEGVGALAEHPFHSTRLLPSAKGHLLRYKPRA